MRADLELLDGGTLNPIEDMDYYCNCLDTHVYMKHIDFYRKYLPDTVEEIEAQMGWDFKERYNLIK